MSRKSKSRIRVRSLKPKDFDVIADIGRNHYPDEVPWTPEYLQSHLRVFPEGQIVAADMEDDRLVGYAASLIVKWDDYEFYENWNTFTDHGWFTNHDPAYGRTLYGADIMVDPTRQGEGIGKLIYKARFDLCRELRLKRIRSGARLIGYHRFADSLSPEEYVYKIVQRELTDPTLSFQLKRGFRVIAVARDYLRRDKKSLGHAAVIEWINHNVAQRADYAKRPPQFARHRKHTTNP